jgi:hypothetical protein
MTRTMSEIVEDTELVGALKALSNKIEESIRLSEEAARKLEEVLFDLKEKDYELSRKETTADTPGSEG